MLNTQATVLIKPLERDCRKKIQDTRVILSGAEAERRAEGAAHGTSGGWSVGEPQRSRRIPWNARSTFGILRLRSVPICSPVRQPALFPFAASTRDGTPLRMTPAFIRQLFLAIVLYRRFQVFQDRRQLREVEISAGEDSDDLLSGVPLAGLKRAREL